MKEMKMLTKVLAVIIIISVVCAVFFPKIFKVTHKNNAQEVISFKLY